MKKMAHSLLAGPARFLRSFMSRDILARLDTLETRLLRESCGNHGKISETYFRSLDADKIQKDLSLQEKIDYISYQFFQHLEYNLDILTPKTFNEKMQWLKVFYEDPLITKCSDKYLVREYVEERIGSDVLVPLVGAYSSPEEIDFNALPDKFVLKVNWGSGLNIICHDKKSLNIQETKDLLSQWMKKESNHYYNSFEFGYKDIKPKIICEQYIEQLDGKLLDYKFYCFNGRFKYVHIDFDRQTKHTRSFYNREWEKLNFTTRYPQRAEPIKKPDQFDKMIEIVEALAKGFIFVRVDLYNIDKKIYFGELTFYHGSGMEVFTPQEWDAKLGELITLPQKILHSSHCAI